MSALATKTRVLTGTLVPLVTFELKGYELDAPGTLDHGGLEGIIGSSTDADRAFGFQHEMREGGHATLYRIEGAIDFEALEREFLQRREILKDGTIGFGQFLQAIAWAHKPANQAQLGAPAAFGLMGRVKSNREGMKTLASVWTGKGFQLELHPSEEWSWHAGTYVAALTIPEFCA